MKICKVGPDGNGGYLFCIYEKRFIEKEPVIPKG